MSGAARPALVTSRAHFPLGGFDVAVIEVEGTVQLVYLAPGYDGGPIVLKALSNQFAGPETSGQLRAIADHLDAIDWAGRGMSEVA
jgi:hypothetical protein